MNITKQIFKKSVLVGTIALSIAVFAGCSDSANSSTADTTKPTEAQTTVQATEGTAKSGTTNESFDLKSLHTCKENDEDDLVGTWQITSGEGSQYTSFYYMFNGEGKSILISGTSGYFGKYSYDTDQQKTVKSTYAWNIFKNTWETESRTVISRYETETSVEYSVWNKEKGSFDLSKKYIYITDNNNQLIAQYAYKMNSRTNQWILEKDALTPIYENIYATTR